MYMIGISDGRNLWHHINIYFVPPDLFLPLLFSWKLLSGVRKILLAPSHELVSHECTSTYDHWSTDHCHSASHHVQFALSNITERSSVNYTWIGIHRLCGSAPRERTLESNRQDRFLITKRGNCLLIQITRQYKVSSCQRFWIRYVVTNLHSRQAVPLQQPLKFWRIFVRWKKGK